MLDDRVVWVARDITERRQLENISEVQRSILELIATGAPLPTVLTTLTQSMEARSSGLLCSVMVMDADGQHLRHGAASGLPNAYNRAIDGIAIGPQAGSCGTAAFRGELVIVSDIKHDLLWDDDRDLALEHGLRACWSKPILSAGGNVLGTFSMYDREPRSPGPYELSLIDIAAYLASIAIERQRAEDALRQAEAAERERVAELEAVRRVSLGLTTNLRFPAVLDDVLNAVFRLMADAANGHIFLYDSELDQLTFGAALRPEGGKEVVSTTPRPNGLTYTVAHSGETVAVSDMRAHPLYANAPRHWKGAIIGLPLKIGQRVVGVMNIAYSGPRTFAESELRMLGLLADQAAIAIENARLFQAERVAREQAEALREVAGAVNSSLDRTQVLRSILEQLSRVVEYDSASVMLVTQNSVTLVASRGFRSEAQEQLGSLQIATMEHIKETITQRHPVIIEDTASDKRWQPTVDPDGNYIRCWLGVPLVAQDQVIGLLNLDKEQPGYYTGRHARLAAAFANQAAVAIVNAQLFEALAEEKERIELLYDLSQNLANTLDPYDVAARAIEQICASFDAFQGAIFIAQPDSHRLTIIALTNSSPDRIEELNRQMDLQIGQGVAGWVAEHRIATIVDAVAQDPRWFVVPGMDDRVRSVISAPLVAGNTLVGVISLYSDQPSAFREEQLPLLNAATTPMAAALQNARLFDETRRHADEVTAASGILHALNSSPDVTQSFPAIVAGLRAMTDCERVSLALLDESRQQVIIAALDQPRPELNRGARFPLTATAASEDVLAGRPHLTPDLADEISFPIEKRLYDAGHRSRINLPLRVGSQVTGALNLIWSRPGAFARINLPLVSQIADALALAIEKMRFFEESRQRDAILESLAYGSQRLLMPGNLGERLLDTLAHLGQVISVSRVYVFENHRGADGTLFTSQRYEWCASGFTPQIDNPDLQNFPYVGGFERWEQVLGSGQPLYGLVRDFPPAERTVLEPQDVRSLAIVPVFSGGVWWGFLGFDDCARERVWASAEIETLKSAAAMLGAAFARQRSEAAEREQRALAEALRDTASALTSTLNFDDVLDRILANVGRVVPHDSASIMLTDDPSKGIDGQNGTVRIVRCRGFAERGLEEWALSLRFPVASSPKMRQMLESRQPIIVADTQTNPDWIAFEEEDWIRSYIGAPILVKGRTIGFLNLDSTTPEFFTAIHAERLQVFADQAAVAIENAHLYDSIRQNVEELALLYRASAQLINPGADVETLAAQIASVVTKEFKSAHCAVWLMDETGRILKRLVEAGELRVSCPPLLPVHGTGLIAAAARNGEVIYVPDVRDDPRYLDGNSATRSELAVPLKAGGRVIGALNLESPTLDAFDERTRRIVMAFAERAGLALENTQLLARLDLARRAAEEASQLKSEFLANTSHELRTPLTGIIGSLSMVLDGLCDQPEEEREFIQIAYTASEHLLAIINNVLDIAKIEAGRLEVELQALDLAALFGELRLLARVPAEEKKLHLELRPPEDRGLRVWADPDMLRQIMVNLVGNAIKFTEEGSVIVRADSDGGWAQITVRDTGIGIPPDKQAKLFQPFVQADGSMTRKYSGTGLGLSISRRLAERMGGTLTLYSAGAGQGTTLTLRLPLYENVESAESNGGDRANPG